MMSSGVLKNVAMKWVFSTILCVPVKDETPSLGLSKTLFAFMIAIGGAIFSVAILVTELLVSYFLGRIPSRNNNRVKRMRLNLNREFTFKNGRKFKNYHRYGYP